MEYLCSKHELLNLKQLTDLHNLFFGLQDLVLVLQVWLKNVVTAKKLAIFSLERKYTMYIASGSRDINFLSINTDLQARNIVKADFKADTSRY